MNQAIKNLALSISIMLLSTGARAEENCLSISDIEFSKRTESSEISWQAVANNDCGPEVSVMLNVLVKDGDADSMPLYSAKSVAVIEARGRKPVSGTFFAPRHIMSNVEEVDVTVGQVSPAY